MFEEWIEELQAIVIKCWSWHSPALQVGFRFAEPDEDDEFWEIWVYPAVQEIVGGKEDGETVWACFSFDVLKFLEGFASEAVAIKARQHAHPPELTFEGKFRDHDVFLHVCLEPLDDVEATEILDLSGDEGPVVRDKE
jgi:hypothetical protein